MLAKRLHVRYSERITNSSVSSPGAEYRCLLLFLASRAPQLSVEVGFSLGRGTSVLAFEVTTSDISASWHRAGLGPPHSAKHGVLVAMCSQQCASCPPHGPQNAQHCHVRWHLGHQHLHWGTNVCTLGLLHLHWGSIAAPFLPLLPQKFSGAAKYIPAVSKVELTACRSCNWQLREITATDSGIWILLAGIIISPQVAGI